MEPKVQSKEKKEKIWFWNWVIASVIFRLILIYFPKNLNLASRPEVSTPLTSLRRLAEGFWLKQLSMSPYAGSMYHGSPLLLSLLGPITVKRIEGQPDYLLCSLVFVIADIVNAMLIRATGQNLQMEYTRSLNLLDHVKLLEKPEIIPSGDIAALVYLWNPFTIVACVGLSTSPIENLAIILSLYGACKRQAPLAAFGWVIATHLSLYPAILIIPMILLLGYGPDTPPRKLFLQRRNVEVGENPPNDRCCDREEVVHRPEESHAFSWRPVIYFLCWTSLWSVYVLVLCGIFVKQYGGLWELFKRTYGFILTVQDLSPNIGVLWYFFAEVFDFFRNFFLIVFHGNILFMMLPLAIRLKHRPCFLAFVYIAISSMLKSYPSMRKRFIESLLQRHPTNRRKLFHALPPLFCFISSRCLNTRPNTENQLLIQIMTEIQTSKKVSQVGDSALYLGLLGLFVNELADMQFSFFLFCGYVGVSLLSPVMHNLWIWRGTGNANFYFATAMAYACLQIILVVESVSAMLNHDRTLRKPLAELQDGKN